MGLIKNFKKNKECRISGSSNLVNILDLGLQPLANSLKKGANDSEKKFSLSISFCPDSSLLQLNETVDKEILFDHYVWVTGTSLATRKYADAFSRRVIETSELERDDLIVEIGSNDGTFLKRFIRNGFTNVVGVDPAKNIAKIANQNGITTLAEFWGSEIADAIVVGYGHAKVVIARNVIAHVSELLDVIEGIEKILHDDGVAIIEFHYAGTILEELHYDSIYHEHLCYFSIKSMCYLLDRFNLIPFHIDTGPISGGSYVIYSSKCDRGKSMDLEQHKEIENEKRVNELCSWQEFARQVVSHRQKTLDIFNSLNGNNIIGFGSSARSQTYLNYCGIDSSRIKAIIDNNPLKQGLYTPGSSIPIVSLEQGMLFKPDLIFILAWTFRDEIVKECRMNGYQGEFLVAFPQNPHCFKTLDDIS